MRAQLTRRSHAPFRPRLEALEDRLVPAGETGLRADFYNASSSVFNGNNLAVTTTPVLTRIDQTINSNWGNGSPAAGINVNNFAVRWSGQVQAQEGGSYRFRVTADDWARLWVNGVLIVDRWSGGAAGAVVSSAVTLVAGQQYDVRLDYYENAGSARAKLEWDRPVGAIGDYQVVPASRLYPFSKPTVLDTGGLYVGSWESLDVNSTAVRIATESPVRVERSVVRGRSLLISNGNFSGDYQLRDVAAYNIQLTVRDTKGVGLYPDQYGRYPGRFIWVQSVTSVVAENNYLESTGGILLQGGADGGVTGVSILRNQAKNIDGRRSDGAGGWLAFNERTRKSDGVSERGWYYAQFLQISGLLNAPNVEVAWNRVENDPGNSRVEDNINLYISSGTAASPMRIHDNFVRGAYTAFPTTTGPAEDSTYTYNWGYTGGGILVGDNPVGADPDPAHSGGHVKVYNNRVVDASNYGVAIAGGHDQELYGNRVVGDGRLPDGSTNPFWSVGLYVWDLYGEYGDAPPSVFFNNYIHDNANGLLNGANGLTRNDYWFSPFNTAGYTQTNNASLPDPITAAGEEAEFTAWKAAAASAGVTVGTRYVVRQDARSTIRAAGYDEMRGVVNFGAGVGYLDSGDWVRFRAIDFGSTAATVFRANVATAVAGTQIQVRVGSPTGTLLGTLNVPNTGGWGTYTQVQTTITATTGVQDIFLVFSGAVNLEWITFA